MSLYIGDPTLGIGAQARAVLAMLSASECDDLGSTYTTHDYEIEIHTWAWYNGREKGVCLEVRPALTSPKALLVTFGEQRNGDGIFVDSWEVNEHFLNPPTVADFPAEAYEKRVWAPYGNVAKAVEIIRGKIKEFVLACNEPVPARILPELGDDDIPAQVHGNTVRIPNRRAAAPYRLAPKDTFGGGGLQGEVTTSYKALCDLFGLPQYRASKRDSNSDGKVSTQWVITNDDGEVFTIYDYKETSLYDRENPSPTAFRKLPSYDWHIGGSSKTGADRFIEWLRANVREVAA